MFKIKIVFLSFLFLLLATACGVQAANAAVPHLINYQGRLTDSSGVLLNGAYSFTFRIYDSETAGNLLWEETQSVTIQKGIFSVLLGGVTNLNLPFDKQYFLEIKVVSEVMTPRQRIASSAYAIRAGNVDSLPKGIITIWSGKIADIPSGWALCDGVNGTPDLRDRFVMGAGNSYSVGGLGGSAAISIANLPEHNHNLDSVSGVTDNSGAHTHAGGLASVIYSAWNPGYVGSLGTGSTESAGSHTHPFTLFGNTSNTGSGFPYVPPYYALAFIIKTE